MVVAYVHGTGRAREGPVERACRRAAPLDDDDVGAAAPAPAPARGEKG